MCNYLRNWLDNQHKSEVYLKFNSKGKMWMGDVTKQKQSCYVMQGVRKSHVTYVANCTKRPLHSKASIAAKSSGASSKLKTSKLLMILLLVTDLGMTMFPLWIWYLMRIWAGDLLYFLAIATSFGSSINWASPGFAQGLSGDPSGE